MKKRILPILLIISPYIYVSIFVFKLMKFAKFLPIISLLIVAAVFIPNIIYAFVIARHGESSTSLLFWDMLLKLCNVPIYIIVFIFGFIIALFPKGFIVTFFLVIFDYILLIPSSMYGVSGLLQARREGKITTAAAVGNIVLHFLFCTDVISAVVMYCAVKKKAKMNLMMP